LFFFVEKDDEGVVGVATALGVDDEEDEDVGRKDDVVNP
jgi:hypothetical protein